MSKLKHLSADAEVKSIVAAVEQDGAVILDNVISEEFIAALREETDPYMDQTVNGEDPFAGFKTTRTGGLMVRSSRCRDLIEHETVLNPCREFLARNSRHGFRTVSCSMRSRHLEERTIRPPVLVVLKPAKGSSPFTV